MKTGWVLSKHALSKLNKLVIVAEQKGAEGGLGAPVGPCVRRQEEDPERWEAGKASLWRWKPAPGMLASGNSWDQKAWERQLSSSPVLFGKTGTHFAWVNIQSTWHVHIRGGHKHGCTLCKTILIIDGRTYYSVIFSRSCQNIQSCVSASMECIGMCETLRLICISHCNLRIRNIEN